MIPRTGSTPHSLSTSFFFSGRMTFSRRYFICSSNPPTDEKVISVSTAVVERFFACFNFVFNIISQSSAVGLMDVSSPTFAFKDCGSSRHLEQLLCTSFLTLLLIADWTTNQEKKKAFLEEQKCKTQSQNKITF